MIKELSVQEQRYQAVSAVLADGVSVSEAAQRWGVSRQSVHTWLRRYEEAGLAGLASRSTRPGACPHQMPGAVEAVVLELRRAHPGWGPRRILYELGRADLGGEPVPSRFDIGPEVAARAEDARAAITRFDAELSAMFDGEFALRQPSVTSKLVQENMKVTQPAADNALRQLQEAGALSKPKAVHGEGQKRNVVWQATGVLAALDRFSERARRTPRTG